MEFDLPKGSTSIIKVIGVGGGGSNAVNHMFEQGIKGVDFLVCNTDRQALDISPVPYKIQLGPSLTEGRGAGSIPEVGRNAAVENLDEIKVVLQDNTKMVFVTAGMGGGTGTGAAPVIAKTAKEMGILTVGIVTVPFAFEGRRRRQQAEDGLAEMRKNVDTLLVINNERLREVGGDMTLQQAFTMADNVLSTAAKGIAEVISVTGLINIDFNDVNTVMRNSGVAIMGSASAEGEDRAIEAVKSALNSPLLNDNDISGAEQILLNITYGDKEVRMDEIMSITEYIQDAAGGTAEVNWGHCFDASLGEKLNVTLVATGFNSAPITGFEKAPEKVVNQLEEATKSEILAPLSSPTDTSGSSFVKTTLSETEFEKKAIEVEKSVSSLNAIALEPILTDETLKVSTELKDLQTENVNLIESTKGETHTLEFEFDIDSSKKAGTISEELPKLNVLQLDENTSNERTNNVNAEELNRRNGERLEAIQSWNSRIKKAEGIKELEDEPAYLRKGIVLDYKKHSDVSSKSRFGIGENGLSTNNSFLHDNVD
jgi:cell division protein FtsZ